MANNYCYEHPRPAVVVDCVIFKKSNNMTQILLVKRGTEPYKGEWALPGGFIEENETAKNAAQRELKEETGLSGIELKLINVYSEPKRDPRGRVISVAYFGLLNTTQEIKGNDDAAEARWWELANITQLAFDHKVIISEAENMLANSNQ